MEVPRQVTQLFFTSMDLHDLIRFGVRFEDISSLKDKIFRPSC